MDYTLESMKSILSRTSPLWMLAPTLLLLSLVLVISSPVVHAQASKQTGDETIGPRVHEVAAGENLTSIAELYGVTIADLKLVNHLRDDDILNVGRSLLIPGGDVSPAIIIHPTEPGDSLQSMAGAFQLPVEDVLVANRSLNPQLTPLVGQPVALVVESSASEPVELTGFPHIVQEGETLLELSARYDVPASHLVYMNNLAYPARLFPGQRLRMPGDMPYPRLPGEWREIRIKPQAPRPGDTVAIYVKNALPGEPGGSFAGQELHFAPHENGYVALVGLDAFAPAGDYALQLVGQGEQAWYPFEQSLTVSASSFPTQTITVPQELSDLLEPSIRAKEDAFLSSIYGNFTEEKQWDGLFQVPVTDTLVTAPYGGGRSYNDQPVTIFHSGTDFDGEVGTPILAAADGTVVFDDLLELRGNAVIIDHGWGIMTGYYHLSESFVDKGERVLAGQGVGAGGSSGLSTGPHLHWELRVMDVPVDGMRWTEEPFP